ncbi:MAG: aminotransferase class I/II-fold pyridoxal phosphate-dependent enzyme [Planctomycetaceae bacterium]|nr:aminotransferase class I/II-fold pyridoxal phosphate-dependent enzyme [Planctomycetaceae bacterium]
MTDPSPSPESHPSGMHPARMGHPRRSVTSPGTAPIFQTAAFDVPDLDVLHSMVRGDAFGHIYTRDSNPNHDALADSIARLEGAEAGAVFASGMAAVSSVFLALMQQGDHLIIARTLYGRTLQLVERMRRLTGGSVTFVDVNQPHQFHEALTPQTRFAFIETVANPLLQVADVQAVSTALGEIPLIVDATFTTPILSQPLRQGAAIVLHSASKYLNGHGDVMSGVAAGSRRNMKRLLEASTIFGSNPNPFESWLCQRGLRTLPLRMEQICRTTGDVARFLDSHPLVRRTWYPGLPSHPDHETACRLYPGGTGGIVTFELSNAGQDAVSRFMRAAPQIPFAPTLADARTTISHPASTSHRFLPEEERTAQGITDETIRLSIGLEPADLIIREISAALEATA